MKKKLILKLIETNDTPDENDLVKSKVSGNLKVADFSDLTVYADFEHLKIVKPYGISDEEIKEGDTYLYNTTHDSRNTQYVLKQPCKDVHIVEGVGTFYDGNHHIHCKKVEILPEQFNYQDIIDLGLKDGDEFELEGFEYVEDSTKEYDSGQPANKIAHILTKDLADLGVFEPTRMNTDIPDISKPSQVLYTEEEYKQIAWEAWSKDISPTSMSQISEFIMPRFEEWFNLHKKK